ncbi:PLP-dependent transferase [Eremomyces bilateralis CBS 781.70]|uniref:PLP-dependent transferase n=1 Tax=Eremomyces bilateralis CBS 781.70 TaxID=1392243 RepID=A0A6G1G186_9PEZI|nr:PLP-dependent transferase [Eremomyces bilateralis CBS 781.70]KAF1811778.1 PLP-dependent transferase [Eremomyces bilateralis CBS 781.70]
MSVVKRDNTGFGHELKKDFLFDERFINLNHGSFGAFPRQVQDVRRREQEFCEAQPDPYIRYESPLKLDQSRAALARLLKVPVETVVLVKNATTGINTVLRALTFAPGDHIVTFSTIYGACGNSVRYICETTPAESVTVDYTYPVSDHWLVDEFKRRVKEVAAKGGRVRLAIFDTVVSMPGLRVPFERLTKACKELGVLSCVDAAHGVGHVDLDISRLDCDFLTSNCHKWLFVPRGCAMLYVPLRNQHLIRSTIPTSHGLIPLLKEGEEKPRSPLPTPEPTKSAFEVNFEFVGTTDNTPYACIPAAIEYRQSLGGEEKIREYVFHLARNGGRKAAEILGTEVLGAAMDARGESRLGDCAFANVRLPMSVAAVEQTAARVTGGKGTSPDLKGTALAMKVQDWVMKTMIADYDTLIPLILYGGEWWARLSGQIYLDEHDFEFGAEVLKRLSERVLLGEIWR